MIENAFNLSEKIPLYVLGISLYTSDSKAVQKKDKIHLYHNYHDKHYFFRNCYVWLTLSLKLLWATFYTFDNKNNLNYHNIMKLPLCQKRRVVNKSFLFTSLLPLQSHFPQWLKKVFFFSFSFFYFRFWVGARNNVSL